MRQSAFCPPGASAVITGAGRGIGLATAVRLAGEGIYVIACDLDADSVESTSAEIVSKGGLCFPVVADVTKMDDCQRVAQIAAASGYPLRGLVNNAAVGAFNMDVESTSLEDWEQIIATNLTSIFLLCKYAIPHLRAAGGGVIVNIASQFGSVVSPGRPAYHATKGAVIQLTKAIAIENTQHNIRAVTVSPGAVETDRLLARYDDIEIIREKMIPNHPIGRLGQPEDIAGAALFVASDDAAFMTGSDLIIDGGYTAV